MKPQRRQSMECHRCDEIITLPSSSHESPPNYPKTTSIETKESFSITSSDDLSFAEEQDCVRNSTTKQHEIPSRMQSCNQMAKSNQVDCFIGMEILFPIMPHQKRSITTR
jgi:hypothetical protein